MGSSAWSSKIISASTCRLASGDADGRVAVWDVLSGAVTGALEDPLGAATGRRTEGDRRTGVVALAWLRAAPALVGVALAGGMFVLWDPRGAPGLQSASCSFARR